MGRARGVAINEGPTWWSREGKYGRAGGLKDTSGPRLEDMLWVVRGLVGGTG